MTAPDSLRVGLVQLCVGDDPAANLPQTVAYIRQAAALGAQFVATPEATNMLSPSRRHQAAMLHSQDDDPTLATLRAEAKTAGIWLLIGSLCLRQPGQPRFVNRSFLIAPNGTIVAHYDKIHMFDVCISAHEHFRESAAYQPGDRAVIAAGPVPIGLSVCYDLRFPHLFRRLAQGGARILTVPSAFHPTTGAAHWQVLLRARAIETGCFVLAPAQTGTHPAPASPDRAARRSYGHSLAVDPWGQVLADGGCEAGVSVVTLDLGAVDGARSHIPSLDHQRDFDGP